MSIAGMVADARQIVSWEPRCFCPDYAAVLKYGKSSLQGMHCASVSQDSSRSHS